MQNKNKPNIIDQQAFTILELVVVAAITITLTSFFIANFAGQNIPRSLNAARNVLVSDLRKAQSNSLSSKNLPNGNVASEYGIIFDLTNASQRYSFFGDDSSINQNRSTLNTTNFNGRVYLKSFTITRSDGTTTSATSLQTLFSVPYGRVLQTYSGGAQSGVKDTNATVTITLGSLDDATQLRNIVINGITGSIY